MSVARQIFLCYGGGGGWRFVAVSETGAAAGR